MGELIAKYGMERLRDLMRGLLDYSEELMRVEIAKVPPGWGWVGNAG